MYKNKVFFFLLFISLLLVNFINGEDDDNIEKPNSKLNVDFNNLINKLDTGEINKLLSENNMQGTIDFINNFKNNENVVDNEKEQTDNQSNDEDFKYNIFDNFNSLYNKNDQQQMMKFYMYIQNTLNSKTETSEKIVVKSFLRKSIKNIKENENNKDKKSIDDIINNTDGYNLMFDKLVEIMKLDKETLKDPETKKRLDGLLVGMIKFVDYTNNNDVYKTLLNDIEIKKVKSEDGSSKSKYRVNINNNKAQIEMLKKASSYMGINISHEYLEKLTSNHQWYENFINNILSNSDEL